MKTFKQYLKEKAKPTKEVPANVDLEDVRWESYSNYLGVPKLDRKEKSFWSKYINNLGWWMGGDDNDKKIMRFLIDGKEMIAAKHRKSGTYYRGLNISSKDAYASLKSGQFKSTKLLESWTKSEKVAKHFSTGQIAPVSLVLSARILKRAVVLDVESWVLDRATVLLGAAATNDNFGGMGWVKGPKAESEILIDTEELSYVPFEEDFISEIKWNGKKMAWAPFELLLRVDNEKGERYETIRTWMNKYKKKDNEFGVWRKFANRHL